MKIVQNMRRDAARLTVLGLCTGVAAVSAANAARCETSSQTPPSSSLGQAIFTTKSPTSADAPSPVHSPEVQQALAAAAAETAEAARRIAQANAAVAAHAAAAAHEPTKTEAPAQQAKAGPAPWSTSEHVAVADAGPLAFGYPLPGHAVNSRFGLRQLSFEPHGRMHEGVDIAAPKGSEVHAAAKGVVSRTGLSSSYGNFVEVTHADGLTSFYAHMGRTAGLKPGAQVTEGEVLGFVGSTGHSTGPHLHFEIRKGSEPLDPQAFMGHQFASAADLPLAQARAPALFAGLKRPMRVFATLKVRGRARGSATRFAALHHYRGRTARG